MRVALQSDGYYVADVGSFGGGASRFVLELAGALGDLYIPPDCDPEEPVIRTDPNRGRRAAPFDRPEAIGWHGDFATHQDRPEISLVYVIRPDPRGGDFGAWRLASVARVLDALCATPPGRAAFDFLSTESLPFTYSDAEEPHRFFVIEPRQSGRLGLRFYLPSIERGCIAACGEMPKRVAVALAALGHAADEVAEILPTREGSLLIASNWFALHDRVRQTVSRTRQNREAMLCFVARQRQR